MRIALVCGNFRPSHDGVAHYTARLAAELAARGSEVLIVTRASPAIPADRLERPGPGPAAAGFPDRRITVVTVAERWDLRGVAGAARALRALRADVVHVQFAPSAFGWRGVIGLLPALLGNRSRLMVTLHEYDWWAWAPTWAAPLLSHTAWPLVERRGLWDRETGLLSVQADTVVATNPAHVAALRRRLPSVRACRIPIGSNLNPVKLDRPAVRRAVRAQLGMPAGATLLAFFGFIHAVKGIRYLLEATARLHAHRPNLRLVCIGGFESLALPGPQARAYEAEVRTMIADQGLVRTVTVTGWVPDSTVSRLLAAADVAVLPFTAGTTTKSGALLACAEHGLPLVCTAAMPHDPALVDGQTAVLVVPRDAASLAEAVARVLDDPTLKARLADGAQRIAAAHGWGAIADAHLTIYRAAAGSPVAAGTPEP